MGGAGNAHRSEAEVVDLDIAADEPDLRASSLAIVRGPTGLTRALGSPCSVIPLSEELGPVGHRTDLPLRHPSAPCWRHLSHSSHLYRQ